MYENVRKQRLCINLQILDYLSADKNFVIYTIFGKYALFTYVEYGAGRSKVSIRRFPVPNVLEDFGAVPEEDHFVKEMGRHVVHAAEPHRAATRRPPLHL